MTYELGISQKSMKHGYKIFDKKYFGLFFDKYDHKELMLYYRWFIGWVRFIDRYIDIKNGKGKRVLEIGCMLGSFAKILKERGFEVVATDISKFIIDKAKQNQKDITFLAYDIEKESKARGKFDYIFAFEVMEHLKDPNKTIIKIKNKLKPNGMFAFTSPIPTREILDDPMHINVHQPNYWISIGKSSGFKKAYYKHASFIPFLYRFHSFFSRPIPIKTSLPFINHTIFYFFKK